MVIMPPIPHSYSRTDWSEPGPPPHPPSTRHWLGTDNTGRDVLARIIWGYRNCMLFALFLTVLAAILGIAIGALQGYAGGWTDLLAQRFIEMWASLPALYVVILVGSIYGRSLITLVTVLALFEWIGLSYYMRAEFLRLKGNSFVTASRALGAKHGRVIFRQILPNALGPAITLLPFTLVGGITSLTALDFLGFGLQPPAASWGEMLQQGLDKLNKPWLAISSVSALFITLLLANFVGEGVRAAFDPKASSKLV
jgi:microcin C transport system permease protein